MATFDLEDVEEWELESRCPFCGPDATVGVAGAVRPVTYLCRECGRAWVRPDHKRWQEEVKHGE